MNKAIQFLKRSDGVHIAFSKFGKGSFLVCPAPWVTSLSYISEDPFARRFWGRLAQGVTVVSYDKHGCGQSDRDREAFTLDAELEDLEAVVDHMGLTRFNMLGSSMAGPIAVEYASRHPERIEKLILYGTYARGGDLAPDDVKAALVGLVRAAWGLGSKAFAEMFFPGAGAEELQSIAKYQRDSSDPETAARLLQLSYDIDVTKRLQTLRVPTAILHREADKLIPVRHGRELAAQIPNSRLSLLKGNIHPIWYGDSKEIIRVVFDFLEIENRGTYGVDQAEEQDEMAAERAETTQQATIVFSDIVSSTDLVTELGDSPARELFLKHDRIVREQLRAHGGKELQNLGDGFMVSFDSASAAIRCACKIQRSLSRELSQIKVRIGINTGEILHREGKQPFGRAVVLASRICAKATGGQILVSDLTKNLLAGGSITFTEKGRFKPKGFDQTIKVYEVPWR